MKFHQWFCGNESRIAGILGIAYIAFCLITGRQPNISIIGLLAFIGMMLLRSPATPDSIPTDSKE